MAQLTIPGGKKKGTPLDQADDNDIKYWLNRISTDLEANPEKRFANNDRAWCSGARAELERRNSEDAHGQAKAKSAAIQRTAEKQGAPQALAISKAMGDPAALTAHLGHLGESHHLVSPATTVDALPPGCGVAVSYVAVNASTAKDGPGEVYPLGGGKVGLSGTTLAKIGACAGVDWDPSQSGRLDNGSDPHYAHFRAVGHVRNFDGSVRTLTGEVEIDARDGSPQIDEITTKAKAAGRDPASQILELRKFLLRHAESKAKNRAIASMGLKRSYVPAELDKPFAVCRLMWTGQTDDPELRRVFAEKTADAMIGGMASLYGKPAPQPAPAPHALPAPQRFEGAAPQFLGHAPPPVLAPQETAGSDDDDGYETGDGTIESTAATSTPLPQARQQTLPSTGAAKEY
jgi:hypothetical protein